MILTIVDKSLFVKFCFLSQDLAAEALQRFRKKKKVKKGSDAIISARLISLIQCLKKRNVYRIGLAVVRHNCQRFVPSVWIRK